MSHTAPSLSDLVVRNRGGFGFGYCPITRRGEPTADTGIDFGILRLREGHTHALAPELESAALLLSGEVVLAAGAIEHRARRRSLFDDPPTALHAAAGDLIRITAQSEAELAIACVENPKGFAPKIFDASSMLDNEDRGSGLLDDTARRWVRTLFDIRNRPEANLVLGEVLNRPGRWSSYPPHHHPQPELYHYRFAPALGYGHAELGDAVVKVHSFDTVKILDGLDHPQVAAPGYQMGYVWVIRHLPGSPYTVPEFTAAHAWTLKPAAPR
jgi:5-deoxy-glucuronate isomerase